MVVLWNGPSKVLTAAASWKSHNQLGCYTCRHGWGSAGFSNHFGTKTINSEPAPTKIRKQSFRRITVSNEIPGNRKPALRIQ